MELREIEIFLVLAEELHFSRTAERLHVSQARVSQAIKKQERRIGAPLFERTSRSVKLTEVGRQLYADLQPVYVGLHASVERARMVARGVTARLRVGLMPHNIHDLHPYWHAFRERYPQWELQLRRAPLSDTFAPLRDGSMDVLVVWLPVDEPDLTVGPTLFTDPRVLAVSADHELASRHTGSVEMFADYANATVPVISENWEEAYLPFHTPRGHRIERTELVNSPEELINLVATGEIVHGFPAHVTRYWSMAHVLWLPLPDLPNLNWALVWRTDAETAMIRALAATVSELGTLQMEGPEPAPRARPVPLLAPTSARPARSARLRPGSR